MKIAISEISPADIAQLAEAGINVEAISWDRQKVAFMEEDGSSGVLYIENETLNRLGVDYLEKNTVLEYSSFFEEWLPKLSQNAYYNDLDRFPPIVIEVRYEHDLSGEYSEIYKAVETGREYMRQLSNRKYFAKWLYCTARYGDGNEVRANVTFVCNGQRERVRYDDWNGPAAYSDTFNPNFGGDGQ